MKEKARQPVLVSACLLGEHCRYDGDHCRDERLESELAAEGLVAQPFCPEQHGGLGTPRAAAWIEGESASAVLAGRARMVDEHDRDVTAEFLAGAKGALELCRSSGATRAFLKERSPSCGVANTYAGGLLVEGPGVTTELLQRSGIRCVGVEGKRKTAD